MSQQHPSVEKLIQIAERVVDRARKSGAEIAEAVARNSSDLSAKVRLGAPELITEAGSASVGLRVITGARSAVSYTSDTTDAGLALLVRDAIELATLSQPDELALPPDPSKLARDFPSLELFDPEVAAIDAGKAKELALTTEAAARALDPRITNSEGAELSRSASAFAMVTSGGFRGGWTGTHVSLSVEPVADDEGGKKQVGSYWDSRRFFRDLEDPAAIGEEAARRTVAKLGSKKVETCEVPVVFSPDAGRALLSALFSCIDGHAIYRRSSYLVDREGEQVASELVTLIDDPLIPRGPGSRPFDGEGLPARKNVVIERGVLKTYLLDTYSARKLQKESTASASRGVGSAPTVSASNFILSAGSQRPADLEKELDRGLYVTSMMGFGFNAVTGDFSRGANGFWIERGARVRPVSEITISLNFNDLWRRIDAVAGDLILKSKVACPTFRVSRMTLAGG